VPVLSGVEALVTKTYTHNCVIMQKARGLRCWGDNEYSQLGVSQWDYPSLTVPPDTDVLTDVYEVATGFGFTCAVKGSSRNLYCWGSNEGGQLGIGSTIESITLEQALSRPPTKSGARLLSCGINTCCVSDMWTGRLFCWGSNSQGLLGLGSDVGTELAPVQLSKLPGRVLSVSVSDSSACAVVQTGGIGVAFCWGSNNNGKLGANLADGTSSVPVRVVLPRRVYAATIAASYLGMCVTTPGGAIYCAGEVGASSFGGKPVQLPVRFQARDVIAGYDHFCSRNQKRHLYCWGSNDNFEAGGSVYDITSKDSVMVNVRFSS
jgi:alpha-tubulin suppressor-like RCC1 family protein